MDPLLTLFLKLLPVAEEINIPHFISYFFQENECLKKEVFEKSSRIEEQNHKIGELINQNQR